MPQTNVINLEQVLKARDDRAIRQKQLLRLYKLPVVSFTLNIPGSRKKTSDSKRIFEEGYKEIISKLLECGLPIVHRETHEYVTGFEAFIVVSSQERKLKELAVQIENTHPLGRLMDVDVIGLDGISVSRESLGYPQRKCLICDGPAHACARNRTHSVEELSERIKSICKPYFQMKIK